MKHSNLALLVLLSGALLTMAFQCRKDYPEIKPTYEFSEKLSLTPYKKSYSIGDTIWVQFQTTDKSLFDKLSNSRIPTDTTFFQVVFNYHKRYIIGTSQEFFCDTKVDNPIDLSFTTSSSSYNVLSFKTSCSSSNYFFRIGFIPKKIGIYSIEPNIFLFDCPNKINRQYSTLKFVFDLADCNKDVWLSIPPASRGGESGFTDVSIDNKELFVFKVE